MNLQNGSANLSIRLLLPESSVVGDAINFTLMVSDSTRLEPFENRFTITVQKEMVSKSGSDGERGSPSESTGSERDVPGGIDIPKPIPVVETDWGNKGFDQFTALEIRDSGERGLSATGREEAVIYDFLINVDNIHLKRFLKAELKPGEDDRVVRTAI